MVKKLRQIWERKGQIDIFDLENDFYLVSFQHLDDYMEALTGGPWVILDAYLNVARWRPDFCPKNAQIESVVAWVRLPDFPTPLFNKKFLLNLGNAIGKAIKLDIHTAQRARGKFARMCVELDFTKALILEFNVEGHVLSVVYESLGLLCTICGWFGHNKEGCAEFHRKKDSASMDVEEKGNDSIVGNKSEGEKELWKTVQRTRRQRSYPMTAQPTQSGSRFSVLAEDVGVEGVTVGSMSKHVLSEKVPGVDKVQKEGIPNPQRKKGVNRGMGVKPRTVEKVMVSKEKTLVKEGQHSKMEKTKGPLLRKKPEGAGAVLIEIQNKGWSVEGVPESNPSLHKWNGVTRVDKENLHPGMFSDRTEGKEVLGTDGQRIDGDDGDPIEAYEMCSEEGGETLCLGDVRGATSKGFAAILRDLKHRHRLDVVVILEPRVSGSGADRIIKNWGFKQSVRREAEGFLGGIWILWNLEELVVDVILLDEQFIHCNLCLGGKKMAFTAVHASPNESRRHRICDILYNYSTDSYVPWLLAGDFNEIKSPLEQKGGGRVNESRCRKFKDWIQDCNFIDIDTHGPFFTWKGPKWNGLDRVYKRLDRCLCNVKWQEEFENAVVKIMPRIGSDHHPIICDKGYLVRRGRDSGEFKYLEAGVSKVE
ncbi:hypothetical protein K1719_001612 [Acacia pycnantha]|nr:hypothetical protein K1719_001612 [Acacia pycnantha]